MRPIGSLLVLVVAGSAQAQLARYDAGTAGNPPVAPDPVSQGWTLVDPSNGGVVVGDVSPDGQTGWNAWKVDDGVTFGGGRLHYAELFPAQTTNDAAAFGWALETRMRMLSGPTVDIFLEYASGTSGGDDRYLLFFTVAGPDVIAHDFLAGQSYVCPGAMDGEYHTFAIRKPAGIGELSAVLSYDGTPLGPLLRAGSNGNAPDGGVHWGAGSSGATGAAHFQSVVFRLGPPTEPTLVDVFQGGDGVYPAYRIPSILTTAAGTLLAFAEGRQSLSDHAMNDIVMRRSTDGGDTWGPVITLHDDAGNSLNNPCAVEVREGLHAGRILLQYQRYPEGCHESCVVPGYTGPDICRGFVLRSDDDGQTWTVPEEITTQVKRPTVATSIASGPGIGIQKRRDPHAGRIVVPYNQGEAGAVWRVYAVYSDDGGDTWTWGDLADDTQSPGFGNEVQMVELADGALLLNSRSAAGTKHRKVAWSHDGGETWTPLQDDLELPEPQVMASVARLSDPLDLPVSRILYAGPDSQTAREKGTIRLSYDEGDTWPTSKLLYPGAYAYSVLTVLADGRIGCLFERDGYARITLARFSLGWLTDGADCLAGGTAASCPTSPNSVGSGAEIATTGSPSITAADFVLNAHGVPLGELGLFFYGTGPASVPLGDGVLCVGGPAGIFRLPVVQADALGQVTHALDFGVPPASTGAGEIVAGTTYYFQLWYRDPNGPVGSGFNFSDALVAGFCR